MRIQDHKEDQHKGCGVSVHACACYVWLGSFCFCFGGQGFLWGVFFVLFLFLFFLVGVAWWGVIVGYGHKTLLAFDNLLE